MWYFRYAGQHLKDSRFGKVARFQDVLSKELTTRGEPAVAPDGIYGKKTRDGIVGLCDPSEFSDLKVLETDSRFGAITFDLWTRIMTTVSPPTVHERAFVISLSHESQTFASWNHVAGFLWRLRALRSAASSFL
jgi:hypothetical protein